MKKIFSLIIGILILACSGCYQRGKQVSYKLGIDPSFIPLNTMGQENHLYGFCYETLQEVGASIKTSIQLSKFSWDDLLPNLKAGKLSGIITTLPPYNFYKKDYIFSEPLIRTGPVLICMKETLYRSFSALEGKILGVISASPGETLASTESPSAIQTFQTPSALLDALTRGQIDAALLDSLIAYAYCRDLYENTLIITSAPFGDSGIRFMAKKEAPEAQNLCDAINRYIGSSDQIQIMQKWGLPSGGPNGS